MNTVNALLFQKKWKSMWINYFENIWYLHLSLKDGHNFSIFATPKTSIDLIYMLKKKPRILFRFHARITWGNEVSLWEKDVMQPGLREKVTNLVWSFWSVMSVTAPVVVVGAGEGESKNEADWIPIQQPTLFRASDSVCSVGQEWSVTRIKVSGALAMYSHKDKTHEAKKITLEVHKREFKYLIE